MDWEKEFFNENEKPLEKLVGAYSNTSIFRTIACVGDSLSSGEFELHNENGDRYLQGMLDYSWGQFLARKIGSEVYNFSRGGMTAGDYVDFFAEEKGFWDKEKACQAYIIALGRNDLIGRKQELGSIEDVYDDYTKNKNTFAGNYGKIISRYKEISPNAKFFFVTFAKECVPEIGELSERMVRLMYDFAERFDNSYVIDLYNYAPVYDEKFKEKYFMHNHMNPMGYVLTARFVDSYIDYIIRHNTKDFEEVGYIGKEYPTEDMYEKMS